MAKRGILVGERSFRTKTEADAYVRQVRDQYEVGAQVTDADDQQFLLDLLAMHPESPEKIGPGVDHFEVRDNGSTVGFWVVRSDGSSIDFSFKKCLRAPGHEEQVRGAMRAAVRDQKFAARDAAFAAGDVRCPVTGELLPPETCHVHPRRRRVRRHRQRLRCGGRRLRADRGGASGRRHRSPPARPRAL